MSIFSEVLTTKPKRSYFDLSHSAKLTCEMGDLIPIACIPTLPKDVFTGDSNILVQLAPMLAPCLTEVNVYTHWFYVPNRIIQDHFTEIMAGTPIQERDKNGNLIETETPPLPRIKVTGAQGHSQQILNHMGIKTLYDYLGYPAFFSDPKFGHPAASEVNDEFEFDILPFKAYQLIYNEYYRDQNLSEPVDILKDVNGITPFFQSNGSVDPRVSALMQIQKRAWQKDYFTAALPWPQAGEDVTIPFLADLEYKNDVNVSYKRSLGPADVLYKNGGIPTAGNIQAGLPNVPNDPTKGSTLQDANSTPLQIDNSDHLYISKDDLNQNGAVNTRMSTINEFRKALATQSFLETEARSGRRWTEWLQAIWHQKSSDKTLQRPQYLGGGRTPVTVQEVLQTSQTTETSPQGQPTGAAASIGVHGFPKFECEEYGFIMCILSVIPKAEYMQGMPRKYQKFDRYDYALPQFANIGEQEIKTKELMFMPTINSRNEETFGYIPRYAEYKSEMNRVHGDFRESLNFWHLGRYFATQPLLNQSFIDCTPDTRIYAVEDSDFSHLWINVSHTIKVKRSLPYFGTPSPIL